MRRAHSWEKTLRLGKIEGRRRQGRQDETVRRQDETVRWPWTWEWASSGRYWKTGKPGMLQSMGSQRVRHDWATEQQHEPKSKHWWPYLQRQGILLQFPSSSLPPLAWVTTVFSQVLFLLLPLTPLWSKFRTVTRYLIQELTRLNPFSAYIPPVLWFFWERASLIAQLVKNLSAMQETLVWFLDQEDPLENGIGYPLQYSWTSLVAQLVKNTPAIWETWVWSLG